MHMNNFFPLMKNSKTKSQSHLTDGHLEPIMGVVSTNISLSLVIFIEQNPKEFLSNLL